MLQFSLLLCPTQAAKPASLQSPPPELLVEKEEEQLRPKAFNENPRHALS